jgi:tRNA-splicing ligase RtcB
MDIHDIKRIGEFEWEISKDFRKLMQEPVRIFASEAMIRDSLGDRSLEQAVNATALPGLAGPVCVMPDVHQGYGFPIGGVAVTRLDKGVISPGAIGYDINCGVRLLASHVSFNVAEPYLENLAQSLYEMCPSGIGSKSTIHLSNKQIENILVEGSLWAQKAGYATAGDIYLTEDNGCLKGADSKAVSRKAVERGTTQVGSLGSGNHFIEVDIVQKIFNDEAASLMGLVEGNLALQIHSGSRGLGHQICTDFVREFQQVVHKYKINLPDRELVCAPLDSPEGQRYLAAMRCAANYAFCNRQVIAHFAREAFERTFSVMSIPSHLFLVYDLAHNMGKVEQHRIQGVSTEVCIHRKGATRAFGPDVHGVPDKFKKIGQPVLIPGSMGTASWVMVGCIENMEKSFGSCCHGAGRVMSRSAAKKSLRGEAIRRELSERGISILAGSLAGIAEEAPQAYKDVDDVIRIAEGAGLAQKVARLVPVAVIKG